MIHLISIKCQKKYKTKFTLVKYFQISHIQLITNKIRTDKM